MQRTKKISNWKKIERQIEKATDGLGLPLDAGIKNTVIAFNANGFITQQSCEGHLDRAQAAPWIHITAKKDTTSLIEKADELFKKAHDLETNGKSQKAKVVFSRAHKLMWDSRAPVIKVALALAPYLEQFYYKRSVSYDTRLGMQQFGNIVRIESIGSFLQDVRAPKVKKAKLKEYQIEMNAFGEFLKEKYFS
jgi:hypothetical protein